MNTLISQRSTPCPAIALRKRFNFIRTLASALFLTLSLSQSHAAGTLRFNSLPNVDVSYGTPSYSVSVTGISYTAAPSPPPPSKATLNYYDFRTMTLIAKTRSTTAWWKQTTGLGAKEFEAKFEIYYDGDGDGWSFVYGTPSQIENWLKAVEIEDGGPAISAGADMYGTDRVWVRQGSGNRTFTDSGGFPSKAWLSVTIKVSGSTLSIEHQHGGGSTKRASMDLSGYSPGSDWQFYFGGRNGADYGEIQLRNISIVSNDPPETPTPAPPAPIPTLSMSVSSSDPSVFQAQQITYTGAGSSGSFVLIPQDKAEGGSATISVSISATDGAQDSKSFTATLKPAPKPSLNNLTDVIHQEGVRTNRTYTVDITGLSDGDERRERSLTITASSSNPNFVANPTVNYASPADRGSLSVTVAPGPYPLGRTQPTASGTETATITVFVKIGDLPSISKTFRVTGYNAPVPTLDAIGDQRIAEDAQGQVITLTGINDGDARRDPELVVKAVSDNPILLPNPRIEYRFGNSTAALAFTPSYNQSGSANISVTIAPPPETYPEHYTNAVVSRTFKVTVTPTPDPVVAGAAGGVRFDGFDDRVEVPRLASIALGGEATFEFWQRVTRAPQAGDFTFKLAAELDPGGPEAFYSQAYVRTNLVEAVTPGVRGKVEWNYGSSRSEMDYGNLNGLLNVWTHWAFVVSTNDNALRIYRDGVLQSEQSGATPLGSTRYTTGSGTATKVVFAPYKLVLGAFRGELAEFRIWNLARSEGEIRQNKDKPLAGNESGLMVYHRFLDGTGLIVTDDASGETQAGSQPGVLVKGTSWVSANDLQLVNLTEGALRFVQTVSEGSLTNSIVFPAFDADVLNADNYGTSEAPRADVLTFAVNTNGLHGRLVGRPETGTWLYTPGPQFSGRETIPYTVTDTQGYSTSGTIQLVVLTRNDPPLISGIPDQTIFESGTVVVPFSVSDPDSPAELAKVTVFSSDRTVLRESGLTLRQYGTNWTLTLRPTAGESGFSKVRLTAFDGQDSSTREFEVQVQPRPMFQVLDLGELLGKPFTWAAAINDRGQVVGWAANDNAGGGVRGFFYDGLEQGGRMFQIPTLDTSGGGFNRAYGINLDGDVTGVASFSDVSRYHAFKWHFGELLATDLGAAPGGELSGGFAINSLGDVAGYGMTSGRTSPAAFWRDAQWHRINSLAAPFNGTNVAFAVNDSGLVVGVSYGSGGRRAFYFNAVGGTEPSPLGLLAGVPGGVHTNTSANAVNNGGSIAGVYSTIKMPYGRILELDGRTGQLASSGGPLDLTNQTFTIELWFRRSGARGAEALLSQGAELQLGFDAANQLYARCAGSDFFGPALIDSKWHHVALVLDGPAAERRLYLDGVPVTRETVVETHSSQGPMTLGAGVGERFQGAIDDLRIWKIARSLVEIRRGQYGWGINLNSDPNLLARWQFDAAHDDRNYAVSASGVYTTDVYAPIGSSPASRGSTNTFRLGFESTRLGGGAGGLNAGATNVALIGNRLYVAEGSAGVEFFDRSESGGLVRVGGFDTAGSALAVAATTNRLFVADGDNGLVILDLTSPGSPSVLATYKSTNGPVAAVKLSGGLAIITLTNSLEVVDVSGFVTQLYSTNLVDLLAPTDQATFLAAGGGNAAELIDNRNPTWAAGVFATNLESGLLVTVTNPAAVTALRLRAATATTIVTGLKFTSANDAPERDPTSYLLSGSDDGVNFRTISSSSVPAFTARGQVQSVSFPNTLAYTFYKLTFPTVANPSLANSMQIAEVELIRAGGDVTLPGDTVVPTSSDSPAGERVANVIDNNLATKYLNLAKLNTGFTVTPAADPTVVTGLSLTSASDAPERDPASYTLSGSNDGVNFTTISSGPITAFTARGQVRSVSFTNTTAFTSYKLAFPTVANPSLANGMQIAEVELIGTFDISRPSDAILATSDRSPAGEDGYKVIDNNPATKYLNFDKFNAGFTIIPTPLGSATMGRIRSFSLYGNKTTNAAEFVLLARGEFPEVSAGATAFVPVSTLGGYTYYKLVVNSLYGTGATRFALSELELLTSQVTPLPASPPARLATVPLVFGQILASVPPPAPADVTRPGNTVVATSSNSPGGEGAANVIDNNSATKYLNLDKLNTGFTVTPAGGLTIVTGLKLTSANDAPERDPASYALSGSLDGVGFTPIASGSLRPFTGRGQTDEISFTNTVAYSRYKLIFPTVLNAATANSMQIAEVELIGVSTTFSASVLSPSGTGWAGDTSVGPDKRAWSAGGIPDSQSRSMETSVTGPGTASFLWKVSSERNYDFLTVFLDGTEQEKISGEVDWTLKSIAIASGSHTLRWTYSKDGNAVGGSDRGWVANVEMRSAGSVATSLIAQPASADLQVAGNLAFVTSGTNLLQIVSLDTNRPAVTITSDPIRLNLFPLPQITQQPVSVTNNPGGSATFRVAASGDNPQYQWLKAGQTLTGATGPTLTLTNLSSGDGTNYSVRITNAGGAVTSSNAVLTVAGVTVGGGTAGQAGTQISTEPLGQAVDAVAANFAGILAPTGTGWAADTSLGSDKRGFSAGGLPDSQSRSMQVSVTGPGLVNFIWKVSSEARYDFLTVELDGVNQAGISGEVGWETKSISIPTGTHTLRWTYAKDGSVTSGADRGWVVNIDLQPVGASRPTADRLQSWSTGGNADWVSQTAVTHDTVDAAASGGISHSQSSWMETSVYGPGAFSFWWKVSSESSYDYLRLIVDGRERESISGDVNWTQRTLNLDAGRHTVRWAYTKDHSVVSGADKGYVDQVEFLPVGGLAITEQPAGQSYVLGQRVTLRSAVSGSVSSYTLVRGSSTWAQARTNAAAQGGYLATITSDAEWVEITRQVTVSDLFAARAWLGATDEQSEGTWKWITGEPFSYSRWNGGEPNNLRTSSSDGEDYLHINSGDGRWNDLSRAEFSQGYLMERAVVTYQWRRDGIDLAGATNALLTLTNAQLADAGAYTMLVRDSSGLSAVSAPAILAMQPASGASATTVGASGLGIEVRVFNDNRYVDTSAGANGEYANVVSSLNSLGFRPIGFFGTNFGGARVVVVPKLEKGAPSLTASERQAWASYVTQGGSLIVMHETAGKWLNSFLGTRLDTGSLSGAFNRGLAVIGTEYADDVSSLQALGVSRPLTSSSLATEARRIYEQSNQAIVADFFVGKGRVTYLGVEWSNMVPLGMQDGGWLEVLRSAVLESARRRGEERLVLAGLTVPGSVAPGTTVTLRASVAAVGPVTYQWLRDGVAIAGATNTIYSVTAQAGATNAYTVRVSSVAGPGAYESFALSSSPASLTVAGNRVYVAQGASGVEVLDISNPALVKRLGSFTSIGARSVDVFPVSGRLYAFVANGATGVEAWDITDLGAARKLGSRDDGTAQSLIAGGEGAYVSDPSGLQQVAVRSVPAILQHPATLTRNWGQVAEFRVVAEGSSPLRYQWRKNGASIPGATGATFTLASVTPQDAGWYQVEVSNNYTVLEDDKALSTGAGLTVRAFPRWEVPASGVAPRDVQTVPIKRAFIYRTPQSGVDLEDLGGLEANGDTEAFGVNDFDQVVGTATRGGLDRAMLVMAGETFDLNDTLPEENAWALERANAINSRGEIVGVGRLNGQPRAFLLVPATIIGKKVVRPLGALAGGQPVPDILKGNDQNEPPTSFFSWSDATAKLYAVRPGIAKLSWPVSPNAEDTNRVYSLVANIWPRTVTKHIAGAPVEIEPRGVGFAFSFQELHYPVGGAGVTLDTSAKIFNATTVAPAFGQGATNEVLRNQAYTVLRYLKNDGSDPDPKRQTPHFEIVRTYRYDDPRVRVPDVPWEVADTLTYTNHTDYPGKNGYVLFEKAFYDGAGPDRAHDRPTRGGPIIPVNAPSGGKISVDPLVVVWYQMNGIGVAWAGEPRQYALSWPQNGKKIIIASLIGSGDLPPNRYSDKRVYLQPDPALPGFNLNEEHALIADGKIWALRNDLNNERLSEPFALLKYRDTKTREWHIEAYKVVAEEVPYFFSYSGEAGKEIQPPLPLSVLPLCSDTAAISGPGWEDYNGKIYAKSAGPQGTDTNIVVRYFYPLQAGFYLPASASGAVPLAEGACIPWLDRYASTPGVPVNVNYRIHWPDAPILQIGATLTRPRVGLPDIFSMAKAQIIHDDIDPSLGGKQALARLFDPLSPRTIKLEKNERIPDFLKRQNINGREFFPDLPFVLRLRLSYDPINRWLSFEGYLDEAFGVGEPLLLPNVMSERERDRIKELAKTDQNWVSLIDRLYDLTRNPNQVDLEPADGAPDKALRIGLTTDPSGAVVPEEFGALPKALTAASGGVPAAPPAPGNALLLDGENDYLNAGNVELLSQSFTIEFWAKRRGQSGGFPRAILGQGGAGNQRDLFIGFDGGDRFMFSFGGPEYEFRLITPEGYTDTDWHHWACTYDAASGVQRILYDGIQQAAMTNLARPYLGAGPLYLGASVRAGGNAWDFFPGILDEFRIWSGVAKTPFGVTYTSQKRLLGSESGLTVYYRFDDTSNAAVNDALVAGANFNNGQVIGNAVQVPSTAPTAIPPRFLTVVENNDPRLPGLPVGLKVIRVDDGPFRGELKVLPSDNIFDERLTLRHSSDFGGDPGRLEFQWYYHPADQGGQAPALPITGPDGNITDARGWIRYNADPISGEGVNDITLGEGKESSLITLSDNYFICRFRGYEVGLRPADTWSEWVGDPASAAETLPQLAEGWIKRVLRGLNPFDARTADFRSSEVNTFASMLVQAGQRYEGDISFNPSADNLNRIGLIEAYQTVLNRGRNLSIDGIPAVNFSPANNALLLAATKISDLYVLLGNEAYGDAQDPTIGFSTGGAVVGAAQGSVYGSLASSIFCFQNQLDSMLEEELVLLRGRDDTGGGVGARPVYHRLFWNFTLGDGEVAYQQNYNVSDQNSDGFIDEKDARVLFPQGHGDAWGHYLTAIKSQYQLLRHANFTWVPRTEAVLVGGAAVEVDFLDERKFARTASQKAKTGAEIVDLTYRLNYVDDPNGQWQGYTDRNKDRQWGVTEWARRAAQGAYFDWLTGNTILPAVDDDPTHTGLRKVDRTTVSELKEIAVQRDEIQTRLDQADTGLNPLGLAKGAVPFDLDPSEVAEGRTHFEQVAVRAEKALRNAVLVWDEVNKASELLRRNQDSVERFQANTKDQERDFKNRLIEIFGYAYGGDIGPGRTYASGYDGPDLYHYMYVGTTDLNGENSPPAETLTAYYDELVKGLGTHGMTFPEDAPEGTDGVNAANLGGGQLAVDYPMVEGTYGFTAPPEWGQRRAPGEIQLALSDMVQAQARLKQMIRQYDNLLRDVQSRLDDIAVEQDEFAPERVRILQGRNAELRNLSETIYDRQREVVGLRTAAEFTSGLADATAEAFPKSVGLSSDVTSGARAAVLFAGRMAANVLQVAANAQELKISALEKDKETAANQAELDLTIVDAKEAEKAAMDEAEDKVSEIVKLMREEAPLRLEVYNQKEVLMQAVGRYQAAVAKGLRLVEERVAFRKNASSATTQSRYQDMTFRIFRNDALQKYRAQFDLAARYVFLAATAYDYEVNLLGTDTRGGQAFLTDIIRQRSLGQVVNGVPQTGQPGLADPMARLTQNFDVLKTQMGFNNPQAETARFSLRKELFRVLDSSHDSWRVELKEHRVENLWDVPEFKRFCRPFAPESGGPQPGVVIRFPTTVTSRLNLFGWPLGGGDSAYDASRFATKVKSVGVWFSDYDGNGLAITPRIYLVPVGMDILRPPAAGNFNTREWRVVDQALPVPFQLGASVVRQADYIPNLSSVGGTFAEIRRFASFRAFHDAGYFDPAQVTSDSRLIGRSVWNTEWLLIIPGATFLADADAGLDTFIDSVSDIKLYFQTYSYAGN